jgi:hypothetical protein
MSLRNHGSNSFRVHRTPKIKKKKSGTLFDSKNQKQKKNIGKKKLKKKSINKF